MPILKYKNSIHIGCNEINSINKKISSIKIALQRIQNVLINANISNEDTRALILQVIFESSNNNIIQNIVSKIKQSQDNLLENENIPQEVMFCTVTNGNVGKIQGDAKHFFGLEKEDLENTNMINYISQKDLNLIIEKHVQRINGTYGKEKESYEVTFKNRYTQREFKAFLTTIQSNQKNTTVNVIYYKYTNIIDNLFNVYLENVNISQDLNNITLNLSDEEKMETISKIDKIHPSLLIVNKDVSDTSILYKRSIAIYNTPMLLQVSLSSTDEILESEEDSELTKSTQYQVVDLRNTSNKYIYTVQNLGDDYSISILTPVENEVNVNKQNNSCCCRKK